MRQDTSPQRDIYSIYHDYLQGDKIDVGRRFYDVSAPKVVDRIEYLRLRSAKKKVLHVGCLDHPEIISERVKNQTWLHRILSDVAEVCVGIDVNTKGYDFVRRELGVENICLADLSKPLGENDLASLRRTRWDLILCPEVLEHITNHEQFLQNLRVFSDSTTTLIVTVPNAFYIGNFVNALRGFESINSDHKYWFTFYTLSRTLCANGWAPRQVIYYNDANGRQWTQRLLRVGARLSRMFSRGLIMEATTSD